MGAPLWAKELIEGIDRAVELSTPEEITEGVKNVLCDLISNQELHVPNEFKEPMKECYARRLIHADPKSGYVIVAMTWGPGQETPIHDHSGIWCVEGVIEGEISITQYDLQNTNQNRYELIQQGTIQSSRGGCGSLIPPFEYHKIANARAETSAVTLHIYGHAMKECSVFKHDTENWYQREVKSLSYINV